MDKSKRGFFKTLGFGAAAVAAGVTGVSAKEQVEEAQTRQELIDAVERTIKHASYFYHVDGGVTVGAAEQALADLYTACGAGMVRLENFYPDLDWKFEGSVKSGNPQLVMHFREKPNKKYTRMTVNAGRLMGTEVSVHHGVMLDDRRSA